jgi:hypothetical protein
MSDLEASRFLDGFVRQPVMVKNRLRIKTVCDHCGYQFIGNADDLEIWERHHSSFCRQRQQNPLRKRAEKSE